MYNHSDYEQQANASAAQNSLAIVLVDQNGSDISLENGTISEAEAVDISKKLQDDLKKQGLVIKKHEDNIKFLKKEENNLNDTILDLQVTLGKYHSSNEPMIGRGNLSNMESEVETIQHTLKHKNSAAGIVCQLKTRHSTQGSQLPLTKGVLGVVATLGKVDDDNLSRRLSEYLGTKTMLAVVCKTFDSVKAIESYNKEGSINKNSGIHGLGASIGRTIDGRFLVICLEYLRPYVGEFIANDPQRKLDIQKPRLPSGEIPCGFIDYAVNMIYIDRESLFYVTHDGHGLRETLFYHLFSRVHVYQTKEDMLQALPCITNGARSLDGGIITSTGVYSLGDVEEADVKFPKNSGPSCLPADYYAIEDQIKKTEWQKEQISDDLQREQGLLNQAKVTFDVKKQELLQFIAQSSSPVQSPAARDRLTPRYWIKSEVNYETSLGI